MIFSFASLLIFYRGFFKALPKYSRKWMLISALLFLVGFTGYKILQYDLVDVYDKTSFMYAVLRTITKSFEIASVITLIHSLLNYLKMEFPNISIDIEKRQNAN